MTIAHQGQPSYSSTIRAFETGPTSSPKSLECCIDLSYCHNDGKFYQLMRLRSADVPEVATWLQRHDSSLSDIIQNEVIQMFAHMLLHDLVSEVNASPDC